MSIEWSDQPESKSSTCRWHGHRLDPLIAVAIGPAVIFPRSLISG
jgi:hypothetical protein